MKFNMRNDSQRSKKDFSVEDDVKQVKIFKKQRRQRVK